jgi:hypothetical protein
MRAYTEVEGISYATHTCCDRWGQRLHHIPGATDVLTVSSHTCWNGRFLRRKGGGSRGWNHVWVFKCSEEEDPKYLRFSGIVCHKPVQDWYHAMWNVRFLNTNHSSVMTNTDTIQNLRITFVSPRNSGPLPDLDADSILWVCMQERLFIKKNAFSTFRSRPSFLRQNT